jgi:hypothetical protein
VKHKLIVTTLALVCLYLAGCSFTEPTWRDVPQPTRYTVKEQGEQKKLQAARHWQLIADHFADHFAKQLASKLGGRTLYVPQPGGEQAFVGGFRDLLITSLVNRGVEVAASESYPGALVADVRYSIYRFNPDRLKDTYYYGERTMLAAGLWGLTDAAASMGGVGGIRDAFRTGAKVMTALSAAEEGFAWLSNEAPGGPKKGRFASGDDIPQSEILLTVSVANDDGRFAIRYSSIYYTADADDALYWDSPRPGSRLPVKDLSGNRPDCERTTSCNAR